MNTNNFPSNIAILWSTKSYGAKAKER